jgi:diguanylate cyclase (GGDEF)-like protein
MRSAPVAPVYDAPANRSGVRPPARQPPQELLVADPDIQRSTPLGSLVSGAAALARGTDLDQTLEALVGTAATAVGASNAAISLQDPDRPGPELTFTIGLDEAGQAALGRAVGDAAHPLTAAAIERREVAGPDTLALPLIVSRNGIEQGLGAIAFGWTEAHVPADEDDDFALLLAVADLVAVAVDRFRLTSTIAERSEWFERLAHTDPLTGLANMRTFSRVLELELARAGRQRSEVSVAVFDLDNFAATIDAAGREGGDDVLRSVAAVIAGAVRLVDTVARLGGDEFVVIAPGSAGMTVARRVLEDIGALPEVDGRRITVSAGVARFPADGTDAESIVAAARSAAARARTEGRGSLEATPG